MAHWKTFIILYAQITVIIGFHIIAEESNEDDIDSIKGVYSNFIPLRPSSILESLSAVGEGSASNWQASEFQVNADPSNGATMDILEDSQSVLQQSSLSLHETTVTLPGTDQLGETLAVKPEAQIPVVQPKPPVQVVESAHVAAQPLSQSTPQKPVSIANSSLSSPSKPGAGWTQWSPLPEYGWQQSANGGQLSGGSQQFSMQLQGNFADITSTNNVQTNINTYGSGASNIQYFGGNGKPKDPQNQEAPNKFQVQLKNPRIV